MEEYIELEECFQKLMKEYAARVHKKFASRGFEQQRAAWLERERMLQYFKDNPPANSSIAGAHCEELRWLDADCSNSWRLGNEKFEITQSDRLKIANTELWQVTYNATLENFVCLCIILYSEDGVKNVSTHTIETD